MSGESPLSVVTIHVPTHRLTELYTALSKMFGGWDWLKRTEVLEVVSNSKSGGIDKVGDTGHERIINAAIEILHHEANGLRTGELIKRRLRQRQADITLGNPRIHQLLLEYARKPDALIYQPSHGWFRHKRFNTAKN